MRDESSLRWGVIFFLAALGLVRPLLSILGVYERAPNSLAGGLLDPISVTVLISVVWVGVAVLRRVPNPLLTLGLTGGAYGVFAILLQQTVWNLVLSAPPEEAPAMPFLAFGWGAILVTNVVWGSVLGLVAAGIRRLIGDKPGARL